MAHLGAALRLDALPCRKAGERLHLAAHQLVFLQGRAKEKGRVRDQGGRAIYWEGSSGDALTKLAKQWMKNTTSDVCSRIVMFWWWEAAQVRTSEGV